MSFCIQVCVLLDCCHAKPYMWYCVSAATHVQQLMCSCAGLNFTSLPCSSSWLHTDSHDSSCLAGLGDGDCGFRALLVAMLLQVCCPGMSRAMAAQVSKLYHALPAWTRSHAVIAGYNTLVVSLCIQSLAWRDPCLTLSAFLCTRHSVLLCQFV